MATKKTTASKTVKKAAPAKKVAAVKKSVATKKAVPAKKVVAAKPAAKKVAAPAKKAAAPAKPVNKAVPAKVVAKKAAPKKAAPAPVKKAAPAKVVAKAKVVAAPAKKAAPAPAKPVAKKATVTKATAKPSAPAKVVAKKAAPAPVPVKKVEKKVIAPVVKPAPKPVAKKEEPIAKPEVKAKKAEAPVKEKKVAKPAPAPAPKRKAQQHVVTAVPSARSEIVDAVRQLPRKTAPKPGVVIAHRKIEKKAPQEEPGLTMKEYNPSVRSLLDEPEQSSGPVYRYSDEELNEFKELINKRLDNARKELAYLQGLITRKDEAGTDDTDNRFNHMEDGSGAMEREQLSQLAGRQIQFINHLEKAMIRIENKTYGICRVTGKLIDKARLRAVPHATLSIEAKNVMNK
jgi:RNA polymerase-binding transcription factor DksA